MKKYRAVYQATGWAIQKRFLFVFWKNVISCLSEPYAMIQLEALKKYSKPRY